MRGKGSNSVRARPIGPRAYGFALREVIGPGRRRAATAIVRCRLDPFVKLPEPERRVPRLNIVAARWEAVCGRCLERSRIVDAMNEREAWNAIASTEGWCTYEPDGAEAYPICFACADALLDPEALRLVR